MNINLYLENGYLDMRSIIETGFPFIFIPAARGTGKTYGALKYFTEELDQENEIILLRRTQTEIDLQNDPKGDGTSFQPVLTDMDIPWHVTRQKNIGYVWKENPECDEVMDQLLSINLALSTFANIRGSFDYSDVNHVFFDEFIAESHVKKIKNEGMALANFYESVNRNRELQSRKPLQLICAANSVNMANDVFMYFDVISEAEKMISDMEEIRIVGNKLLVIPQRSPISEKKSKTALYQAVNKEFSEMAISNKFILNDFSYVKPRSLAEYKCDFRIGDLYFFRHKSRIEWYVTFKKGECAEEYESSYSGLEMAKRAKWRFPGYYLDGLIRFESYRCIALFEKYFNFA